MYTEPSHRYSFHRAACKQWSVGLGVIILLVGGLAGVNPTKMLWAAGPLLLLGLVEAGYAAQERRYAELLKGKKGNEEISVLPPEAASASVVRTAVAALSLSVWPFYLGLFAMVAIGGQQMAASGQNTMVAGRSLNGASTGMVQTVAAKSSGGCGSGGCGKAGGGCGSSCGASSGKGCSGAGGCGGGSGVVAAQAQHPAQVYLQPQMGPRPIAAYPAQMPQAQVPAGYPQGVQPQMLPQQPQMLPQQAQTLPQKGLTFPQQTQPSQSQPGVPNGPATRSVGPVANPATTRAMPGPLQPPAGQPLTDANSNAGGAQSPAVAPGQPRVQPALPESEAPLAPNPATPAPASNPAASAPSGKKR